MKKAKIIFLLIILYLTLKSIVLGTILSGVYEIVDSNNNLSTFSITLDDEERKYKDDLSILKNEKVYFFLILMKRNILDFSTNDSIMQQDGKYSNNNALETSFSLSQNETEKLLAPVLQKNDIVYNFNDSKTEVTVIREGKCKLQLTIKTESKLKKKLEYNEELDRKCVY
ncbi:MAG: hypothetical protein ACRCUP_07825 [Mycoplasmatales bacterium]